MKIKIKLTESNNKQVLNEIEILKKELYYHKKIRF